MTKSNKIRILLLATLTQPGLTIADQDKTTCQAKNIFPSNYTVECRKEDNLKIILAHPKNKNTMYSTNLDNIPVVLIIGNEEKEVLKKISSPSIYSDLLGLPPHDNETSSKLSPPTARIRISHPSWKIADMRTIEYNGESGPTLVCLTLLNSKIKTTKALLQCSDFYEKDILEIKKLETP
ncbi:hypothetical protein [Pseudomonas nicosulfuronedens]